MQCVDDLRVVNAYSALDHVTHGAQGPIHCAATIVREEGPRGLWSGASPTVLRNGTNQMCLFWAKNHMDSAHRLVAPCCATSCCVASPRCGLDPKDAQPGMHTAG